jgi:hypothetical protein
MIKTKADYKNYVQQDLQNNDFRTGLKSWFGNEIQSFLKYLRRHEDLFTINTKHYLNALDLVFLQTFATWG